MRWLLSLVGLGLLAAAAATVPGARAANAAEDPVVVEFYTSQGCSSCPPADALFAEIADDPGLLALALHVDYWDYLGWKDPFGSAQHTERQRAYARAQKQRTIYTPQMVVEGEDLVIGHDEEALRARIAAHAAQPSPVLLTVERSGGSLRVTLAPRGGALGAAEVRVFGYVPSRAMTVGAGENAGYRNEFVNIVIAMATIGRWDGAGPADIAYVLEPELADAPELAVIVQAVEHGPILAAEKLP